MPHSWNLSEWMNSLGLRRQDQPELIHAVQPVEIVGDHSAHTAPILPPTSWAGGTRAAVAAAYSCIEFTSLAPGGSFIRQVVLTAANQTVRHEISLAPGALANVITPIKHEMGVTATLSTPRLGTLAAEPAGGATNFLDLIPNLPPLRLFDPFYVPAGYTLQLWIAAVNVALSASILWEDCLAQPAAR